MRTLDDDGEYQNAVDRSTLEQANAVQALDRGYRAAIADARERLDSHASEARNGFTLLTVGIPLLLVAAAALVLVGLRQRIGEYR